MKLVLVSCFVLFTVGCSSEMPGNGNNGSGGKKAASASITNPSCTGIGGSICTDFIGTNARATAMQLCTLDGGYSNFECPTTNRIGSCTVGAADDPNQVIRRYYAPAFTADVAQSDCTNGAKGVFEKN